MMGHGLRKLAVQCQKLEWKWWRKWSKRIGRVEAEKSRGSVGAGEAMGTMDKPQWWQNRRGHLTGEENDYRTDRSRESPWIHQSQRGAGPSRGRSCWLSSFNPSSIYTQKKDISFFLEIWRAFSFLKSKGSKYSYSENLRETQSHLTATESQTRDQTS